LVVRSKEVSWLFLTLTAMMLLASSVLEWQNAAKGRSMKKDDPSPDDLREEYSRADLGAGVRGKHLKQYRQGTNLAKLAPDVRAAFPSDEAVNDALRSLLEK
jgi:hypothetical protein